MNNKKEARNEGQRIKEKAAKLFSFSIFHRSFSNFRLTLIFYCLLLTVYCSLFIACQPDAETANSGRVASVSPTATDTGKSFDTLEADLEAMQTADFDFIYIFRRKDGAVLNGEDKKFLKSNSPSSTNRFVLSDDDKAVIAGSKNKFSPENLEALKSYFSVEDHSKPESQLAPGANANANSRSNL